MPAVSLVYHLQNYLSLHKAFSYRPSTSVSPTVLLRSVPTERIPSRSQYTVLRREQGDLQDLCQMLNRFLFKATIHHDSCQNEI